MDRTSQERQRCGSATVLAGDKITDAEPAAHWLEARPHGAMPELEAQLLGLFAGGGYERPGTSPDRADAMAWGVSELMCERADVRVRAVRNRIAASSSDTAVEIIAEWNDF